MLDRAKHSREGSRHVCSCCLVISMAEFTRDLLLSSPPCRRAALKQHSPHCRHVRTAGNTTDRSPWLPWSAAWAQLTEHSAGLLLQDHCCCPCSQPHPASGQTCRGTDVPSWALLRPAPTPFSLSFHLACPRSPPSTAHHYETLHFTSRFLCVSKVCTVCQALCQVLIARQMWFLPLNTDSLVGGGCGTVKQEFTVKCCQCHDGEQAGSPSPG